MQLLNNGYYKIDEECIESVIVKNYRVQTEIREIERVNKGNVLIYYKKDEKIKIDLEEIEDGVEIMIVNKELMREIFYKIPKNIKKIVVDRKIYENKMDRLLVFMTEQEIIKEIKERLDIVGKREETKKIIKEIICNKNIDEEIKINVIKEIKKYNYIIKDNKYMVEILGEMIINKENKIMKEIIKVVKKHNIIINDIEVVNRLIEMKMEIIEEQINENKVPKEVINGNLRNGDTILHTACYQKNTKLSKIIIDKMRRETINKRNNLGIMAIDYAITRNMEEVIFELILRLEDVNIYNRRKEIQRIVKITERKYINIMDERTGESIIEKISRIRGCEDICKEIIKKCKMGLNKKINNDETVREYLEERGLNETIEELKKIRTINCGICFEDVNDEEITYLPCDIRHVVCDECYKRIRENKCPYCRQKFTEQKLPIVYHLSDDSSDEEETLEEVRRLTQQVRQIINNIVLSDDEDDEDADDSEDDSEDEEERQESRITHREQIISSEDEEDEK